MNTLRIRWLAIIIIIAISMMACSLLNIESEQPVSESAPEVIATPLPIPTLVDLPVINESDDLYIELYKRVNPAVVNITILIEENGNLLASGQGSGFFFDGQGHIVTNAHVAHGSDAIDVAFADGTVRPAEIVGIDFQSDLAVLRVENAPGGVGELPLGNINDVQVGQTVVAIGNPFGLGGTLTKGIVSAIGRTIPGLTSFRIAQVIQTDAAINPGSSGGPLINLRGEVIGVNVKIQTDGNVRANSGVAFAVPVSIVAKVIPSLIEKGEYVWPWLGVIGNDLTLTQAQAMNLRVEQGAYISDIVENGPADKAGLRGSTSERTLNKRLVTIGGDVITAINGVSVKSFDDLLNYVSVLGTPGQKVTLTIIRNNEYQDIQLTLEARPDSIEP